MSGPIKRACDCCHKRKIKCILDGQAACRNCSAAGLACTYNSIPQKKGPKGSRAKIISDLREAQQHPGSASSSAPQSPELVHGSKTSPVQTTLLTSDLVNFCIDYYLEHVYPSQPLLDRFTLRDFVAQAQNQHDESSSLISALCSYVLVRSNIVLPPSIRHDPAVSAQHCGVALLNQALRRRKKCAFTEEPTILSVMISFFVFSVYFSLEKDNSAWYHLREATTLALTLRLNEEDLYSTLPPAAATQSRALYWLLFVSERAFALHRHRPVTLTDSVSLPSAVDRQGTPVEMTGFLQLIELFRPFDPALIAIWNKSGTECSSAWLVDIQQRLTNTLPVFLPSSETQAVDLRITQQWLRIIVWQLAIRHSLLSSQASHPCMTFDFPVGPARDLLATTMAVPTSAMEVHGIRMVEKLFDIACSLIDVLACVPLDQAAYRPDCREYLQQYLNLISSLKGGRQRFTPLLHARIEELLPSGDYNLPAVSKNYAHVPSMLTPQPLPTQNALILGEDIYDTNSYYSSHGSGTPSINPSPFGSPPHSAAIPHLRAVQQTGSNVYPFDQATNYNHAHQAQHQMSQHTVINAFGQPQYGAAASTPYSFSEGQTMLDDAGMYTVPGEADGMYHRQQHGDARYMVAPQDYRPS